MLLHLHSHACDGCRHSVPFHELVIDTKTLTIPSEACTVMILQQSHTSRAAVPSAGPRVEARTRCPRPPPFSRIRPCPKGRHSARLATRPPLRSPSRVLTLGFLARRMQAAASAAEGSPPSTLGHRAAHGLLLLLLFLFYFIVIHCSPYRRPRLPLVNSHFVSPPPGPGHRSATHTGGPGSCQAPVGSISGLQVAPVLSTSEGPTRRRGGSRPSVQILPLAPASSPRAPWASASPGLPRGPSDPRPRVMTTESAPGTASPRKQRGSHTPSRSTLTKQQRSTPGCGRDHFPPRDGGKPRHGAGARRGGASHPGPPTSVPASPCRGPAKLRGAPGRHPKCCRPGVQFCIFLRSGIGGRGGVAWAPPGTTPSQAPRGALRGPARRSGRPRHSSPRRAAAA